MIDGRPNIVLVTADSLRADHCGFLGGTDLTPTMDGLAHDGLVFENAIAPGPQTFSSMPAVFTGEHRDPEVARAQEGEDTFTRRVGGLKTHMDRYQPVQERLQELGYETGAVTPNPWTSRAAGFDRGFDHFIDCSAAESDGRLEAALTRIPGVDPDTKAVEHVVNMLTDRSFFTRWEAIYDDLIAVHERLSEPYFLWVFLMDTHIPYLTGRAHRAENSLPEMYYAVLRTQRALRQDGSMSSHSRTLLTRSYRDTVRATDAFLDRFLSDIQDNPVLVMHSDHGESLGDHGHYGHHHRRVYEENIHVPYIIHNAGSAGRVKEPISLASIPDVLIDIAGTDTLDPSSHTDPFVVVVSEFDNHRAVRGRRWKYVEDKAESRLFDLKNDPQEQQDVSAAYPVVVERLQGYLKSHAQHLSERGRLCESADELVISTAV